MHAVARRVLAVAVSVVLLLALLRGGSRYFYCPAMKAVTAASCCAKARAARTPIEEQAIGAPDCCSARHLSTIAPAPVPPAAGPGVQRKESTRVTPNAARHGDEDMMEPFARDGDGAPGSRTAQQ